MRTELRGSVPKLPFAFTSTLINRAWRTVRESNLWSFNLFESAWISPPIITSGTVTATLGSPTIQFDPVVALSAINAAQIASPYSLITQRQFRLSFAGGIYSIIAFNNLTGQATLDRIFADPSGTNVSYSIYQVYYTPPMIDFLTWQSVTNPQMFLTLGLDKTRAWLDQRDPQRSWFEFPTEVVPLGIDLRGQGGPTPSATLGYPLFELWGQPVAPFTQQCYGLRRGTDLVNPTDTLPYQIPEELVMAKAVEYAYEWAEANKDMSPRSSGPDFRFLIGHTKDKYTKLLTQYRRQDKELVDNYFSVHHLDGAWGRTLYYNTLAMTAGTSGFAQ
jgi:hypothetical protein